MNVIFSDECLIWVVADSRRQRVIRPPGVPLKERYLQPTFKSTRVTLMIWPCFSGRGLGPILVLEQRRLGGLEYEEILYDGLLSFVDDLFALPQTLETICVEGEGSLLFMYDNAPCHNGDGIKVLLDEHHIPIMKWPAQSPDLNLIECLGPELKHNFRTRFHSLRLYPSRSYDSVEKYKHLLQEVWKEIGQEFITTLIESMPRCCDDVIAAKGGHTKR